MSRTAPEFLQIIASYATLLGLVFMLGQSVRAQHQPGSFVNSPLSLSSLARKEYLAGKRDESIALYQKAIEKAEQDYGKNSPVVGDLNYEMGVRAYDLCKFDLAEHSLKKATEINPNSLAAQLTLGQLLRFRNRNSEAYRQAERATKKHWNASEARKELMLCLQDVDPASASQQAYIINCLQSGTVSKIPAHEMPATPAKPQPPPPPPANPNEVKTPAANSVQPAPIKNLEKKETKAPVNKVANKTATTTNKAAKQGHHKNKNKSPKTHKEEHSSNLLVPPPPLPNWFGFPIGNKQSQPELKAKAKSINVENADEGKRKKGKKEIVKPSSEQTGGEVKPEKESQHNAKRPAESDSDFLLDWAAIKKKSGKK